MLTYIENIFIWIYKCFPLVMHKISLVKAQGTWQRTEHLGALFSTAQCRVPQSSYLPFISSNFLCLGICVCRLISLEPVCLWPLGASRSLLALLWCPGNPHLALSHPTVLVRAGLNLATSSVDQKCHGINPPPPPKGLRSENKVVYKYLVVAPHAG